MLLNLAILDLNFWQAAKCSFSVRTKAEAVCASRITSNLVFSVPLSLQLNLFHKVPRHPFFMFHSKLKNLFQKKSHLLIRFICLRLHSRLHNDVLIISGEGM